MKKLKISIAIFIIGIIALIGGIAFMLFDLLSTPSIRDADFLIGSEFTRLETENNCSAETEEPCGLNQVIWYFAEAGKGTLTTDSGKNNYDFIWSLDNGKLKIETNWLYTLNDEFTYEIDAAADTLTIVKDADPDATSHIIFTKLPKVETQVAE